MTTAECEAKPKISKDTAEFLRLLHAPGDLFEVRSFECPIFKGARKRVTASGYFTDPKEAGRWAKLIDSERCPPGVYTTINPVAKELAARSFNKILMDAQHATKDEDIVSRRWLFLDIDSTRPAGVSATDKEAAEAIDLSKELRYELERAGWPQPIRGMSGNGAFLLFRIDLPNDPASTDLIRRVLHGLGDRFDRAAATIDRKTFNASRVMKLPGTTARKGENFAGIEGAPTRPHRVAGFVCEGDLFPVSIEQLQAVAASPESMQKPLIGTNGKPGAHGMNGSANGHAAPSGGPPAFSRCRNYVAKLPPAISGQNGSGATFAAAAVCARFGLSEAEAWPIMEEFNSRCQPQWTDAELRHKIDSAYADVVKKGEFGSMNKAGPAANATASATGGPAQAAGGDASASQIGGSASAESDKPPPPPKPAGFRDLAAEFTRLRDPVIHGLLRRGETMNCISASKIGKSWLSYGIILSIITGKRLWDRFTPVPGRVLLVDNELHPETLTDRMRQVAAAYEIDLDEFADSLDVYSLRGKNVDIEGIRQCCGQFEPGHYRLVLLDALYRTYPDGTDENSNSDMTKVFNRIDEIAAILDSAVVLVHHSSKGLQSGKQVVDVGSGAGSIARACDTHLILRPHQSGGAVTVEAAVRSWPPLDPLCLRFDWPTWRLDESLDPSQLKTDKPRQSIERVAEKVLAALKDGPKTRSGIRQCVGRNASVVSDSLEFLHGRGDIVPCMVKLRNGEYEGWEITKTTNPDHPDQNPDQSG